MPQSARDSLGASQTAVAAAIGANRTYYSLFESGRYVLDDQEQGRLREFLAKTLPTPSSRTDTADDIEKAVAALTTMRSVAVEPNGLWTKRAAVMVEDALMALQPLDHRYEGLSVTLTFTSTLDLQSRNREGPQFSFSEVDPDC